VVGILHGVTELTIIAGTTLGPRLGTVLILIALLFVLVFACFSAKMFEEFALHVLQELLTALSAALVSSEYFWQASIPSIGKSFCANVPATGSRKMQQQQ
jgi:hypothetical protein